MPTLPEQLRGEAEYLSDCEHHLGNPQWMANRLKETAKLLNEAAQELERQPLATLPVELQPYRHPAP